MFVLADLDPASIPLIAGGLGFFILALLKQLKDQDNFNRIVKELREEAERWKTIAIAEQKKSGSLEEQLWKERNARFDVKPDNS